jgi:hypothetical protein
MGAGQGRLWERIDGVCSMTAPALDRPVPGGPPMAAAPQTVPPRRRPTARAGVGALLGAAIVAGAAGIGLLGASSPALGIGLIVVGLLALAIALRPDVATLVVIAILYSNAAVIAVKFHGVPYVIGAAVPLLLAVPLAYGVLVQRQRIVTTAAFPFILGFLFVQVLGSLFARDPAGALDDLTTFAIEGIGLYFLVSQVVRTSTLLSRVIWTLLAVGAILGALSLIQTVTRSFGNDYWGFAQVSQAAIETGQTTLLGDVTAPRLAGPIGEKNFYAQFMLMLVPSAWSSSRPAGPSWPGPCSRGDGPHHIGIALTYSGARRSDSGIVLIAMAMLRYIKLATSSPSCARAAILVAFPVYASRLATLDSLPDVATEGRRAAPTRRS